MPPSTAFPDLFEEVVARAQGGFPGLKPGNPAYGRPQGRLLGSLVGKLRPLRPGSPVGLIAGHLAALAPLEVLPSGELVPLSEGVPELRVPRRPGLYAPYEVEVVFLEPPAVPWVFVLNPCVDRVAYPDHPHLVPFRHPSGSPTAAACVFMPATGAWEWNNPTPEVLIAQTSIWLAAHSIWVETGEWVIPSWVHNVDLISRFLRPDQQCWCYSGKPFKDCHMPAAGRRATR